ncbi:MAG TPA: OmpA family protein [Candidatus Kapabacteria bacterium]|nr:OmpA family protein [Candidatus Kapabacteria bacterium]
MIVAVAAFAAPSCAQHHKKKPNKTTESPANDKTDVAPSLLKSDSLVVTEFDLPQSDSADDRPMFNLEGNIMVFGSRRPPMPGETWRQREQPPFYWDGDIYYRVFSDTGWSIPINAGPQINNSGDQNNPTISPTGDEIVFVNGGAVMRSKFINGMMQKPEVIPGEIQNIYAQLNYAHTNYQLGLRQKVLQELESDSNLTELFKRAPDTKEVYYKERLLKYIKDEGGIKFFENVTRFESAFSPDAHLVVFSENFGKSGKDGYGFGGQGDDDLWLLKISPNGHWDSVLYMPKTVNSPFSESYPFVAADGSTVYFSSNRPGGNGGDDIYMTRVVDTGYTKPVALPKPINSEGGDYGLTISADGATAYFVSNRTGKSKFYKVRLRSEDSTFTPKPAILVQGTVTDKNTGKPLRAQVFVDELAEAKNSFSVYSNDSGVYLLAMQRGHRFGMEAVADGHLPKSERFTYPASGKFNRSKLDFQLEAVEVGASTEFKNVYFATAKSDLLPESKLELDRVGEFMKKNRTASIEIDGHTDDVGTAEYNNKLSLDRATSVMKYLTTKGVDKERMEAKGFGKTKPVKKGTDEASRALNRRVEMVVTSYSK